MDLLPPALAPPPPGSNPGVLLQWNAAAAAAPDKRLRLRRFDKPGKLCQVLIETRLEISPRLSGVRPGHVCPPGWSLGCRGDVIIRPP